MNKINNGSFCFITILASALILFNSNSLASTDTKEVVEGPFYYELPEMVVNLLSDGRAIKVLKIRLNLELHSPDDLVIVKKIKPRMLNEFQTYLRHLYAKDLSGSGIVDVKKELLVRANYAAKPIKLKGVLFRGILVQ